MSRTILVVDDERVIREEIAAFLGSQGYDTMEAAGGEEALALVGKRRSDVLLVDLVMPGMGGIELLEKVREVSPASQVILITAFGSVETAVEAMRRGASDYIMKPLSYDDLLLRLDRLLRFRDLESENRALRRALGYGEAGPALIGDSEAMRQVRERIATVADLPTTVLIAGESGTGKEVVARRIHVQGGRRSHPFVAVNCGSIPEHLQESELFGHAPGAFTGAGSAREGFLAAVGSGTLFLDEVSTMPLGLQTKLLRVIEAREYYPVGSTSLHRLHARVIAATNRDLKTMVADGSFREDLYYRLGVVDLEVPPLRQRREDIPLLVEHFIGGFNAEFNRSILGVTAEALEVLAVQEWKGNVRELRNVLERAMIFCRSDQISPDELPSDLVPPPARPESPRDLRGVVKDAERVHITRVLAECGNQRKEAARLLGISPTSLWRRCQDLGIPVT